MKALLFFIQYGHVSFSYVLQQKIISNAGKLMIVHIKVAFIWKLFFSIHHMQSPEWQQLLQLICHNPFLGYSPNSIFSSKNKKYIFGLKNIQKIITVRRGCQSAQKMTKNWLRRFKNTRIEIWRYIVDWWEPNWQTKFNLRKKCPKSYVYWTQLIFIEGLIEFIEGLIARKIASEVNLGFNWKKLKFWGQIILFESWLGQIRGLIA